MTPRFATNDIADCHLADSEIYCDGLLHIAGSGPGTNGSNVIWSDGGIMVSLTPYATKLVCAVPHRVGDIFFRGSPLKIFQAVVRWVTVEVPTLLSGRALADERSQDNAVNVLRPWRACVRGEVDTDVPTFAGRPLQLAKLLAFSSALRACAPK